MISWNFRHNGVAVAFLSFWIAVGWSTVEAQDGNRQKDGKAYFSTGGLLENKRYLLRSDQLDVLTFVDRLLGDDLQEKVETIVIERRRPGGFPVRMTIDLERLRSEGDSPLICSGDRICLLNKNQDANASRRISILGPVTSGESGPRALDPPSDDRLISAISKAQNKRAERRPLKSDKLRILKEKIADFSDAPRFYPLLGPARLHHAHYKVTIISEGERSADGEDEATGSFVFYVDHNHFHMMD
ncbi:MAG: hypothetical protein AAF802_15595 [Planctomycetota bacterium]